MNAKIKKIKKLILTPGFVFGMILSLIFNPAILPVAYAGNTATEEEPAEETSYEQAWQEYLECLGYDDPSPEDFEYLQENYDQIVEENYDECDNPPGEIPPWEDNEASAEPNDETDETDCTDTEEPECSDSVIVEVENSNQAEADNDTVNEANTGNNEIEADNGNAEINTGDTNIYTELENEINTNETEIIIETPGNSEPETPEDLLDGIANENNELNDKTDTEISLDDFDEDELDDRQGIDLDVSNDNEAVLNNNVVNEANSGNNQATGETAEINTGDVNVVTDIINTVNTNSTGSSFENDITNITRSFIGDINLLDQLLNFLEQDNNSNLTVNNTNSAEITNTIDVNASSGTNLAIGDEEASITTGDVNIITNIVNLVNTNFIGSNWLSTTINILGSWQGDLILPGEGVLPDNNYTYQNLLVNNNNQANLVNQININADSGNNTANSAGSSSINTGEVSTATNVTNLVNTNIINSNFLVIMPNLLGQWTGSVINNPGTQLYPNSSTISNGVLNAANDNQAELTNTLNINASSGNNLASGNGQTSIITGDVNVATNIVNLVNTNIIGSNWMLVGLNLLGSWNGNVIYAYPDLTIQNDNEDEAKPGDIISYTLTYGNIGLAEAHDVIIQDTIPENTTFVDASDNGQEKDGVVTWKIDSVKAQTGDQAVTFNVQINEDLPPGETIIHNSVIISTQTPEPELANNTSSSQTSVVAAAIANEEPTKPVIPPQPQLTLEKTNNVSDFAYPGDKVTYQINLVNSGNVTINNLIITDQLTSDDNEIIFSKDFELGNIPSGDALTLEYTLTISDETTAGWYTNTAIAQGQFNNEIISSGQAISKVEVRLPETVALPENLNAPENINSPNEEPNENLNENLDEEPEKNAASLIISETNDVEDFIYAGEQITFKVTVGNNGGLPINEVIVSSSLTNERYQNETKETAWGLDTMLPGEELMITYTLAMPEIAPSGIYTNTSKARGITDQGKTVDSNTSSSSFELKDQFETSFFASLATPAEAATITDFSPSTGKVLGAESTAAAPTRSLLPWWAIVMIVLLILGLNYYIYSKKLEQKKLKR